MAKSYKSWVEDLVANVAGELNLHEWGFEVYLDDPDPDGDEDTVAWTCIDVRYLNCYIHVAPKARGYWDEGRLDILGHTIVHEIVHVLLKPVQKFAYDAVSDQTRPHLVDAVEQATQRITRILMCSLPKKYFTR